MTWVTLLKAFRLNTFEQVLAKQGGNVTRAIHESWLYKVLREAKGTT